MFGGRKRGNKERSEGRERKGKEGKREGKFEGVKKRHIF